MSNKDELLSSINNYNEKAKAFINNSNSTDNEYTEIKEKYTEIINALNDYNTENASDNITIAVLPPLVKADDTITVSKENIIYLHGLPEQMPLYQLPDISDNSRNVFIYLAASYWNQLPDEERKWHDWLYYILRSIKNEYSTVVVKQYTGEFNPSLTTEQVENDFGGYHPYIGYMFSFIHSLATAFRNGKPLLYSEFLKEYKKIYGYIDFPNNMMDLIVKLNNQEFTPHNNSVFYNVFIRKAHEHVEVLKITKDSTISGFKVLKDILRIHRGDYKDSELNHYASLVPNIIKTKFTEAGLPSELKEFSFKSNYLNLKNISNIFSSIPNLEKDNFHFPSSIMMASFLDNYGLSLNDDNDRLYLNQLEILAYYHDTIGIANMLDTIKDASYKTNFVTWFTSLDEIKSNYATTFDNTYTDKYANILLKHYNSYKDVPLLDISNVTVDDVKTLLDATNNVTVYDTDTLTKILFKFNDAVKKQAKGMRILRTVKTLCNSSDEAVIAATSLPDNLKDLLRYFNGEFVTDKQNKYTSIATELVNLVNKKAEIPALAKLEDIDIVKELALLVFNSYMGDKMLADISTYNS